MSEIKKPKINITKTKVYVAIIIILLSFSIYKSMTAKFIKMGNTICIDYKFNFSNNYIDIKQK